MLEFNFNSLTFQRCHDGRPQHVFALLSRLACHHVFDRGSVKRYLLSCCCTWSVLLTQESWKSTFGFQIMPLGWGRVHNLYFQSLNSLFLCSLSSQGRLLLWYSVSISFWGTFLKTCLNCAQQLVGEVSVKGWMKEEKKRHKEENISKSLSVTIFALREALDGGSN